MSRPVVGMGAGMALAFAAHFGGFGAFLLVAALGAVGAFVGHRLDGGGVPDALRDVVERNRR
ncbi:DUF2273 domain-containing protein [[Kitasatospora] papulosa]|uniref:DUF2273 domain-containing protein n=1 Tax=Streptomyces TaxID=1883 RepID=UPI00052794B3|nr:MULTISPECIES: DUF2273 domain-containing protein [Streptomyces]MDF9873783.1 hypothetical protein [Streptomyces pratensis]RAS25980.1 small integral membrane protein DUF2273 [Streptomyces avidinii]SNX80551.1 Small integral membrane protein [Streptomyces microflavus]MCX4413757.1 DUF2273 domain-containing protein [[Kitasatospora] papulosa]MDF6061142.1 DUF2273 domain-containing protein [Streptomyces sp. JH010]